MRILFAGSPEVALPSLGALLATDHTLCGVVSQPARPVGRSKTLTPTAVAAFATENHLPLATPDSVEGLLEAVTSFRPEVAVVVAYGRILSPELLASLPRGWWNVHFSLLPRWRGAAPVQHAILEGDTVTGVTLFKIVPELDAGPIASSVSVDIEPLDSQGSLLERMSSLAAPLVVDLVYRLHGGDIALLDQQGEATFAPKFQKRAGALRLTEPAEVLDRRIRALTPEPGAKVLRADNDVSIGIVSAELVTNVERIAPGELRYSHGLVLLGTGTTPLVLNVVQPAGKKPMPAGDWYRGLPQGVVIHAT